MSNRGKEQVCRQEPVSSLDQAVILVDGSSGERTVFLVDDIISRVGECKFGISNSRLDLSRAHGVSAKKPIRETLGLQRRELARMERLQNWAEQSDPYDPIVIREISLNGQIRFEKVDGTELPPEEAAFLKWTREEAVGKEIFPALLDHKRIRLVRRYFYRYYQAFKFPDNDLRQERVVSLGNWLSLVSEDVYPYKLAPVFRGIKKYFENKGDRSGV